MQSMSHRKFTASLLSVLITLAMVFSIVPMSIFADEGDGDYSTPADTNPPATTTTPATPSTPGDTDTDIDEEDEDDVTVIKIATFGIPDEVLWQGYNYGSVATTADLVLPATFAATDVDGNKLTLEDVTWESTPEFDATVSVDWPGYIFTPTLPEGYGLDLAQDSPALEIAVFIRPEGGVQITPLGTGTFDNLNNANYTIFVGTDGHMYKNQQGTAGQDDFTGDGKISSGLNADGKVVVRLADFVFSTNASFALNMPPNSIIELAGVNNSITSTYSHGGTLPLSHADPTNKDGMSHGIHVRGNGGLTIRNTYGQGGHLQVQASDITHTHSGGGHWSHTASHDVSHINNGDTSNHTPVFYDESAGIFVNGTLIIENIPHPDYEVVTEVIANGGASTSNARATWSNGVDTGGGDSGHYASWSCDISHYTESYGVYTNTSSSGDDCIIVRGNSILTANGDDITADTDIYGAGNQGGNSYGIFGHQRAKIEDGVVTAEGGNVKNSFKTYGILMEGNPGRVLVEGGEVYAYGGTTGGGGAAPSNPESFGIYAKHLSGGNIDNCDVIVTGGLVEAKGGNVTGTSAQSYGIKADGHVTINENTATSAVTAEGGTTTNANSYGMRAEQDVTIDGGIVDADGGNISDTSGYSYGIYSEKANVKISDGIVTADGGTGNVSYGIRTQNSTGKEVLISGGDVEATGAAARISSYGIFANTNVRVTGGEKLWAKGNAVSFSEVAATNPGNGGIYANNGLVEITAGDDIQATADNFTVSISYASNGYNASSYGIRADTTVDITGGKILAQAGNVNAGNVNAGNSINIMSRGVHGGNKITINGATVDLEAIGGNVVNNSDTPYGSPYGSAGIFSSTAAVDIKGGSLVKASTGTARYTYGIYGNTTVDINGSRVEAQSDDGITAGSTACAIYSNSTMGITNASNVVATSGSTSIAANIGIRSNGAITITDSDVKSTSGASGSGSSYGIYTNSNGIEIENSRVAAQSGNAGGSSFGIFGISTVDITKLSTVVATGGTTAGASNVGIYASTGNLTITNSEVTGTGGNATTASHGLYANSANIMIDAKAKNVTGKAGNGGNANGMRANSGQIIITVGSGIVKAIAGKSGQNAFYLSDFTGAETLDNATPKTINAYKYKIGAFNTLPDALPAWVLAKLADFTEDQIWLTKRTVAPVVAPPRTSGSSGGGSVSSGGGSGGGGGGGGASSSLCTTTTLPKNSIKSLVEKANKLKTNKLQTSSTCVHGTFSCPYLVTKESFAAMKGYSYAHNTTFNRAVQVRVYIIDPTKMTKDTFVSGWTDGVIVNSISAKFSKWFKNKIRVIHMDQQENWGAPVRITAKVDLKGMDTSKLCFYSFNKKTNVYKPIPAPNYSIDKNGFISFTTPYAGELIISEKPFVKK